MVNQNPGRLAQTPNLRFGHDRLRPLVRARIRAASPVKARLLGEPLLDEGSDFQIVFVHDQHVAVAAHTRLRQIDDAYAAAGLADRVEIIFRGLPERRPARIDVEIIAEHREHRDVLQRRGLVRVADPRGLDRSEERRVGKECRL